MVREWTGGCLCGGVRYRITAEPSAGCACHCTECRRQTGYMLASFDVPREAVSFHADGSLRWFESSPGTRRGFCGTCGSVLFWERIEGPNRSVTLGSLDGPTGLRIERHVFVAEAGDYYDGPGKNAGDP